MRSVFIFHQILIIIWLYIIWYIVISYCLVGMLNWWWSIQKLILRYFFSRHFSCSFPNVTTGISMNHRRRWWLYNVMYKHIHGVRCCILCLPFSSFKPTARGWPFPLFRGVDRCVWCAQSRTCTVVERRWATGQSASILAAETRGARSDLDQLVEGWNLKSSPRHDWIWVDGWLEFIRE